MGFVVWLSGLSLLVKVRMGFHGLVSGLGLCRVYVGFWKLAASRVRYQANATMVRPILFAKPASSTADPAEFINSTSPPPQ